MKPTTFESEIDQIFGTRGTNQKWQKEQVFSLIQTTIMESLPEKKITSIVNYSPHEDVGFNQCLDTITSNLKEKGVL